MSGALLIAASGAAVTEKSVGIAANNIANARTAGFKRMMAYTTDAAYHNERRGGTETSESGTILPTGTQIGTGVMFVGTGTVTSEGTTETTDNPLDVQIVGKGYFEVLLPDGTMGYTRDGRFQKNAQGQIVTTAEGYVLQPGITVPTNASSITINPQGQVLAEIPGTLTPSNLGTIGLINFVNEPGLERIGGNLLKQTASSGDPVQGTPGSLGFGILRQGSYEGSNVEAIMELVDVTRQQHAYNMNLDIMKKAGQMVESLAQV